MNRSFSPASERNKQPIFRIMNPLLPARARVLEIGAGTGQHAEFFTQQRPDLDWLSTDLDNRIDDLTEAARSTGSPARFRVRALDVCLEDWPEGPFDAVFSANTLHIMPWANTSRLIEKTMHRLVTGGLLFCYGPFKDKGRHNAASNREFDHDLRERHPEMGIRDLVEIRKLGEKYSMPLCAEISLPANNRMIVFRRS
mgnify:CR=1 FL=1